MAGGSRFRTKDEKERYVQETFDAIAPRYDALNRILSGGLDQGWRKAAARAARGSGRGPYLDVGAGTGDLTMALALAAPRARVFGLDLARGMLTRARTKAAKEPRVGFVHGTGLRLPARDGSLEAVTNAFVLRNLADMDVFFRESHRALRPGGKLVSLEIARPPGKLFGPLYALYFFRIMPRVGRVLSGDPKAYAYLADSVKLIEAPHVLAERMRRAGFEPVTATPLFRGAVVLFEATRPA